MRICSQCGEENPERARFCLACGAPLAAEPAPERRKLATLLFCDMSGSTAMGERVDAESVRAIMFSYFHQMRGAIERHGGTVEKFVGDAVMAVFGVPLAHEDDALRACRAALEMQERLRDLNAELERRYGSRIALRIGLNTGEVVAGDAESRETMVTGDAVNVAARLEQAAAPGEILLGELTYRLAAGALTAESVPPLAAKGKSEPVAAYRLLAVQAGAPVARAPADELVGRTDELALLEAAFADAVTSRTCRLVTVLGEAGVGKSRLAAELSERLAGKAELLRGRCLSYGEGITFWPIGEIVRAAAGIRDEHSPAQARGRIEALLAGEPEGALVARRVAQAIGLAGGQAAGAEVAWALRRLLEALSRRRPLLLVVDDLQWAEPALLDLLASLPELVRDAPILLLCLARPELAERGPDWEATVALDPLAGEAAEALLARLLPSERADERLRDRLVRAAAGNPLFLEELAAMLREGGLGEGETLALPSTLAALLGARLDRLEPRERGALERGSVEGEVFHRGALATLSPAAERPELQARLEALAARDWVRPAEASLADEAAFRFRHILVRDAAYAGTAKRLRAELHELFAGWLEERAGARVVEFEEILGYHLEQACGYLSELGPPGEHGAELARRAAGWLGTSGRRALARGDAVAAINLLGRAIALFPADDPAWLELVPDLGDALLETGRFEEGEELLERAIRVAEALGDEHLRVLALIQRLQIRMLTNPEGTCDEALLVVERALPLFAEVGDERAAARAFHLRHAVWWNRGALTKAREASEAGLEHAIRAGDERMQAEHRNELAALHYFGGTPIEECMRTAERELAWARTKGFRWMEGLVMQAVGLHAAMLGRVDEGRTLVEQGVAILEDLGLYVTIAALTGNWAEFLTDTPESYEAALRPGYETLSALGEKGLFSTVAAGLAEAVYAQGRLDEAERLTRESEQAAASDDVASQAQLRSVRAKILARRGRPENAERLARDAVELAGASEYVYVHARALLDLAEVLRLCGRADEARAPLEAALRIYEERGVIVSARKARAALEALDGAAPSP